MLCGFSRFFLKRMNHEDRLGKFGQVKNSMLKLAMNAQFHNTRTDARHRLPVARLQTHLHEMDLMPSATPGFIGKGSKVVERRTQPDYRFFGHEKVYNNLYNQPSAAIGQRGESLREYSASGVQWRWPHAPCFRVLALSLLLSELSASAVKTFPMVRQIHNPKSEKFFLTYTKMGFGKEVSGQFTGLTYPPWTESTQSRDNAIDAKHAIQRTNAINQ